VEKNKRGGVAGVKGANKEALEFPKKSSKSLNIFKNISKRNWEKEGLNNGGLG